MHRSETDEAVEDAHQAPLKGSCVVLSAASAAFFEYWKKARGDQQMPGPSDIQPADFTHLLPNVRYMRWEGCDRLIFTVWGTGLVEWLKIDLTGKNVFDILPEGERETELCRLRNLHEKPCGFVQRRAVSDTSGRSLLFEFLTLPVSAGSDGELRMIGTGSFCEGVAVERVDIDPTPQTVIREFHYLDIGFGIPAGP